MSRRIKEVPVKIFRFKLETSNHSNKKRKYLIQKSQYRFFNNGLGSRVVKKG